MAKMTISQLETFVSGYVTAAKQAGTWASSVSSYTNLVDKIGKQVTLAGSFNDKLTMLDGDNLPGGKTIEEYFVNLTLPENYDPDGSNNMAPHRPTFEQCAYSYDLGRKVIPTTYSYDQIEQGCVNPAVAGSIASDIMTQFANSQTLYTFACKKQLLGNVIAKVDDGNHSGMIRTIPAVASADADEIEAIIEAVKEDVEEASFPTEGTSLGKTLIGAAPELTLFVRRGLMPKIAVKALAGAFNKEELALPAKIVVVDDFGAADDKWKMILVDTRGVKLHESYRAIRTDENGKGDFVNYYQHSRYTGFISKNVYVKVYKDA